MHLWQQIVHGIVRGIVDKIVDTRKRYVFRKMKIKLILRHLVSRIVHGFYIEYIIARGSLKQHIIINLFLIICHVSTLVPFPSTTSYSLA
jgi:hypothetical protein